VVESNSTFGRVEMGYIPLGKSPEKEKKVEWGVSKLKKTWFYFTKKPVYFF